MKTRFTLNFSDPFALKIRNRMLDLGYCDNPDDPAIPDFSSFDEEFGNYVVTLIEDDIRNAGQARTEDERKQIVDSRALLNAALSHARSAIDQAAHANNIASHGHTRNAAASNARRHIRMAESQIIDARQPYTTVDDSSGRSAYLMPVELDRLEQDATALLEQAKNSL